MSLEETMSLVEKQQNKAIVAPAIPFTVTQNSTIKANSLRNVGLILERDELLKGMFAYNSFSFTEEVVREIPRLHIEKGNSKIVTSQVFCGISRTNTKFCFLKNCCIWL